MQFLVSYFITIICLLQILGYFYFIRAIFWLLNRNDEICIRQELPVHQTQDTIISFHSKGVYQSSNWTRSLLTFLKNVCRYVYQNSSQTNKQIGSGLDETMIWAKDGSDKMIHWLGRYFFLLGFIMSKNYERLSTELSIKT